MLEVASCTIIKTSSVWWSLLPSGWYESWVSSPRGWQALLECIIPLTKGFSHGILYQAQRGCQSLPSGLPFSCLGANAPKSPFMLEFWQRLPQQLLFEAAPLSCCSGACDTDTKCAWKAQPESVHCCYCKFRNWICCKAQKLTEKGTCFHFCPPLLLLEAETFVEVEPGGVAGGLQTFLLTSWHTWTWALGHRLCQGWQKPVLAGQRWNFNFKFC